MKITYEQHRKTVLATQKKMIEKAIELADTGNYDLKRIYFALHEILGNDKKQYRIGLSYHSKKEEPWFKQTSLFIRTNCGDFTVFSMHEEE
ncbi:MAG: hypothetical protein LBQ28_04665 [Prevotellaceae bacterium]|jgi:hypothetical protein|nr:hypothetical protein [Prevotellaceae bacterium]